MRLPHFLIYVNGVLKPDQSGVDATSGISYVALGDTRHTLEIDRTNNEYLIWTKPDGTLVKFLRSSSVARSEGVLTEVIYPNGFTISVGGALPSSVRTNTGFQLKYNFGAWNSTVDSTKPSPAEPQGIPAGTDWGVNPHSIQGINAAVEYCSDNSTVTCSLTKAWPTATFSWPNGMPRTLYINDPSTNESGVFSVMDAQKKRTEFHFQA